MKADGYKWWTKKDGSSGHTNVDGTFWAVDKEGTETRGNKDGSYLMIYKSGRITYTYFIGTEQTTVEINNVDGIVLDGTFDFGQFGDKLEVKDGVALFNGQVIQGTLPAAIAAGSSITNKDGSAYTGK